MRRVVADVWMVTGHRLGRLGFYTHPELGQVGVTRRLVQFAALQILEHVGDGPILTGMALGWDQAVATAAMRLGVPYVAALPCVNQHLPWASDTLWAHYFELLSRAQQVVYVSDKPYESPAQMHRRNEWLVDKATHVLALWDGDNKGGTAACVRYAKGHGRHIVNRWPEWEIARKKAARA